MSGGTAQAYLEKNQVQLYLADVLAKLAEVRHERPLEYIADYFAQVAHGRHVVGREFDFVDGTAHNRRSFIALLSASLEALDETTELPGHEYLLLAQLICPDFPELVVTQVVKLLGDYDASGGGAIAPATFMAAFRVYYFFSEFWKDAAQIFHICDQAKSGLLNRQVYYLALKEIASETRMNGILPPVDVVHDVLVPDRAASKASITFQDFFLAMAHSPAIPPAIEALCGPLMAPLDISAPLLLPGIAGGQAATSSAAVSRPATSSKRRTRR